MIVNNSAKFLSVCDRCGETLQGDKNFIETVAVAQKTGWESGHANGSWVDVCPKCSPKADNSNIENIVQGQWYERR